MRKVLSTRWFSLTALAAGLSLGCEAGSSGASPDGSTSDSATADTASGDAVDPLDVVSSDVPVALDVPAVDDVSAANDVPSPGELPVTEDVVFPTDVPVPSDVPVQFDVPVLTDVPVPDDVPWTDDVEGIGCPAEQAVPGSACFAPGLECEWGAETCCGVTHPSFVCSCSGGTWACHNTDACFGPVDLLCPDTATNDVIEPEDGGPAPDVVVPEGPTRLVEAGWAFGLCASQCTGTLAFAGASIDMTIESPGGQIDFMASGILTTGGAAKLDSLLSALDGVPLDAVYGCPDCLDGGEKTIVLTRGETMTSHKYEFSNPPAVLAELDALIFAAADGLKTCTTSEAVVVLGQCPAAIP